MPRSGTSSTRSISPAFTPSLDLVKLRLFALSRRALKITFAVALCSAGAFGVLSDSTIISSSDAVASAYVTDVRTPIDGTVSGLPSGTGSVAAEGDLLGRIDDPRSDHQHLDNLRILASNARSTMDAVSVERAALEAQQTALISRARLHSIAVSSRLEQTGLEATRTLSGLKLALSLATAELRRAEQLHDAGILANSDFDRVRSAQLIAVEAVAAQQSNLTNIHAQAADAARGLLSEAGDGSDVSYSRQRADEIAIKLAETSGQLTIALAQSKEADLSLEEETARGDLRGKSEIRSPIHGSVWKLNVTNGEHTMSGASILTLVDCSQQFILAQVPQDRVPEIAINKQARIRLAGESEERTGTVLSVSGDVLKLPDTHLAAVPFQESSQQVATVLIALSAKPAAAEAGSSTPPTPSQIPSCIIGRSARVLIPTIPTNLASRWVHNFF